MHRSGAELVRYALEQLNTQQTFGVVGDSNRAIYNELQNSSIDTHLVNQEISAAFMADAISRTTQGEAVGTMLITAEAIINQGIAEAFIAGVPMLIIAGAAVSQYGPLDQQQLLKPLTKARFRISRTQDIVGSLFEAHQIATSGKPGPVYLEIPAALQLQAEEVEEPLPLHLCAANQPELDLQQIDATAQALLKADNPALFAGWAAVSAQTDLVALADRLAAPLCTSLQGTSAFPARHSLHAGLAVNPSAQRLLKDCDQLLAIGIDQQDLDWAELPDNIIQLAPQAIPALLYQLNEIQANGKLFNAREKAVAKTIAKYKTQLSEDWLEHNSKGRVNPAVFFQALSKALDSSAIVVTGQGTHRALAAELLPINRPQGFICPSSFNAMGYCVPAVNAIKMANPEKQVVGIVGDGAMMINGMEIQTAVRQKLGTLYCLFNNSQRSTNKNTAHMNWGAFADALECGYFPISNNQGMDTIMRRALETTAQGQPVILEVSIDYSRKTYYAQHQEKVRQASLPSRDRLGDVKRAIVRKIMPSDSIH
jgi:acetolactate synthase-1/2/3 large subunit